MAAFGLGRAKTPERLERVERPPQNCEWQSPDLRQKPQVNGSSRIRFPSVNALLGFSHNQGHLRTKFWALIKLAFLVSSSFKCTKSLPR